MTDKFPDRIPAPTVRKQKKALKPLEIKLIDPVTEGSTELFKYEINGVNVFSRNPRRYGIVRKRQEGSGERSWFVVTDPEEEDESQVAVLKVTRSPTGELTTVVLDRPPPGTTLPSDPRANPLAKNPEVGLFMENFSCIVRGFLRRARPLEGDRYGMMNSLFPLVRDWASEFDKLNPGQVEEKGSMLSSIENHMRCAREILDVPRHEEKASKVFDNSVLRSWFIGQGSNEVGELAQWLRARYAEELGSIDPKLATELKRVDEEKSDE